MGTLGAGLCICGRCELERRASEWALGGLPPASEPGSQPCLSPSLYCQLLLSVLLAFFRQFPRTTGWALHMYLLTPHLVMLADLEKEATTVLQQNPLLHQPATSTSAAGPWATGQNPRATPRVSLHPQELVHFLLSMGDH